MKEFLLQAVLGLLHLLYPKRCPICDGVVRPKKGMEFLVGGRKEWIPAVRYYPICDTCRKRITYVQEPVCKQCGKPLEEERQELCSDCSRKNHVFLQGKAPWVYKGAVKESVYRLKYSNRREYAISYAQEMVGRYGDWLGRRKLDAIIPIPLHRKRKSQRGYNQAELISRELGRLIQVPVRSDVLLRCVNTRPQKELNDKERKNNLKKAFKIAKNGVQLDCVLLVDDIYTTGSTMDGAAQALKDAGVSRVYVISVSIGRGY